MVFALPLTIVVIILIAGNVTDACKKRNNKQSKGKFRYEFRYVIVYVEENKLIVYRGGSVMFPVDFTDLRNDAYIFANYMDAVSVLKSLIINHPTKDVRLIKYDIFEKYDDLYFEMDRNVMNVIDEYSCFVKDVYCKAVKPIIKVDKPRTEIITNGGES
jgi:UDP-2,3-diacylglucosamine pyrophosphatase LpxH